MLKFTLKMLKRSSLEIIKSLHLIVQSGLCSPDLNPMDKVGILSGQYLTKKRSNGPVCDESGIKICYLGGMTCFVISTSSKSYKLCVTTLKLNPLKAQFIRYISITSKYLFCSYNYAPTAYPVQK